MAEPGSEGRARKLFVAGATGATGRTLVRLAPSMGVDVLPHRRPKAGRAPEPSWAEFELAEHAKLVEAMRGCTTVVQLIGTMRKRFASGDTYETSDIGTTRQLVDAAVAAGVDHVVLLSSMGAGNPRGAYLKAKAEAERIVRLGGIPWTVVRPSAFEGEEHKPIPGLRLLTKLPGLTSFKPITLEELASAILLAGKERGPLGAVLEGPSLWDAVARARNAP